MLFEKERIKELTEEKLKSFDGFLVDVMINAGNKILVEVDSPSGISINQCAEINRYLNTELDNETNEFDLTVSSPGLDKPFKVVSQYEKNVEREVKVKTIDGKEYQAILKGVHRDSISLSHKVKEIPEGKKKKEWVEKQIDLPFEQIKETKIIITFK